jgi:hypothetical protein
MKAILMFSIGLFLPDLTASELRFAIRLLKEQ